MNIELLSGSVVARTDGGSINSVSRVTTPAGDEYALRVYPELPHASAVSRFQREMNVLAIVGDRVPIPRPVVADASCTRIEQPYVIYPWINGVTLNECRRAHGSPTLDQLARPLGRALAAIAAIPVRLGDIESVGKWSVADEVSRTVRLLEASLALDRLGPDIAQALRRLVESNAAHLIGHDRDTSVVHGDFGGRNVVVRADEHGTWTVAGILDWESATTGALLWDVGSLFRYSRRYSPDFRAEFARGYLDGGGELPDEWWFLSRLLDVTRVVATLSDGRDLGSVFDECREIVRDLLDPAGVPSR